MRVGVSVSELASYTELPGKKVQNMRCWPAMDNTDYKLDSLLNQLYLEWGGLMPLPRADKKDKAN